MADQFPIFILLAPFFFAFAVSLAGWFNPKLCYPLTIGAMALALAAALATMGQVWQDPEGVLTYRLGGWQPPVGIAFTIDPLNALVLVLITAVALLAALFSHYPVLRETPRKAPQFYTLFLLLVTGLMGMTITGDAFNLYVLLELSSLSSYALIAMGSGRAALSCFNYIIMGTIGASFYLLGVGYLYIKTGSLNMADISRILVEENLYGSETIHIGFLLIMIGVWIKMALFPLHAWLPNAYTFAPSASSSLIAPLMTKVSIYVMIRFMFSVFHPDFVFASPERARVIVWAAVVAIVVGSFFALAKSKLKKMLAYLVIAEVGYMVGGAWLANERGLSGAIFHILSDALMTLCFFFFAGIIYYKTRDYHLRAIAGLFRKMPWTMAGFVVCALSMIGIPPTCGFFSKWYLISGGIESGHWEFVAALLVSSGVNAILFFKIIEIAYFGRRPVKAGEQPPATEGLDEAPVGMLAPFLVAAASLLALGLYSGRVMTYIEGFIAKAGL